MAFFNKSGKLVCKASYNISIKELNIDKHPMTLRHLIDHKAGVMHYSYLNRKAEPSKKLITDISKIRSRKRQNKSLMNWAIPHFFPKHPLFAKPGHAYSYTTLGITLQVLSSRKPQVKPIKI